MEKLADQPDTAGMTRRRLVIFLAAGAAIVAFTAVLSVRGGWWRVPETPSLDAPRPAGSAVRAYFGDLAEGKRIDRWTLVRLYDVTYGAIPVVLATDDGARFEVDLLRRDPGGPRGVADTNELSLFIANEGGGGLRTPEAQGLGVVALAAALTTRENGGARPPRLLTLAERLARHTDRLVVPLE